MNTLQNISFEAFDLQRPCCFLWIIGYFKSFNSAFIFHNFRVTFQSSNKVWLSVLAKNDLRLDLKNVRDANPGPPFFRFQTYFCHVIDKKQSVFCFNFETFKQPFDLAFVVKVFGQFGLSGSKWKSEEGSGVVALLKDIVVDKGLEGRDLITEP